jgi:site-specific DNA-methyltransferase (adenine-specific)/adenine-specific DNA-methyltransferase
MPTLNWIGKDAVIRHHKEVPFRLLEADAALSHGGDTGNLIVQGDNLHALKALLPKYAGKVKCIYIDPPYNTGNEGWVYNDKVNSPEINRWLGSVVGKEAEDLSRHDKWLCMMYPRMVLLKQFLAEDGAIFVSIDDNEVASLRLLMDEIFGKQNFVAQLVWKARQHLDSRAISRVSTDHEYLLVFSRNPAPSFVFRGKTRDETKYANPDNDPSGPWMSRSILGLADALNRPNLHYEIDDPKTGRSYPCPANTGWRYAQERMEDLISRGRILFPKKVGGRPREKVFLGNLQDAYTCYPSIIQNVFTDHGTAAVRDILGSGVFSFPKPPELVASLIEQATDKDSIILDSFAGSGTTGHAVLKQNAEDGGTRKFILVEMEEKIARDITAERVRRVAGGYTNAKGEAVAGLGGGFQFCTLSEEPLFNEFGDIREDVRFAQLADFVWFAETGEGYMGKADSPLLGAKAGTAVYLLFNGILGDRRPQGGNILTQAVLDGLPEHKGPKVIYAAAVKGLGPAALQRAGIVFKQTPYAIEV